MTAGRVCERADPIGELGSGLGKRREPRPVVPLPNGPQSGVGKQLAEVVRRRGFLMTGIAGILLRGARIFTPLRVVAPPA
jgi:hypothetical protein